MPNIRHAAVAGQFYPAEPDVLRDEVTDYLKTCTSRTYNNILIAPHAGYIFSASVAAKAYARISPNTNIVILIGPSHREMFQGIHLTNATHYETPLGLVEINQDIAAKLRTNQLFDNVLELNDKEHCLEVHLPFLQILFDKFTHNRTTGDGGSREAFTIVPLLTGKVDITAVADILLPFINETTTVIASGDLSHFLTHSRARETDDATIATILSGDINGFMDSCGETAIRIVMDMAAKTGLSAELLDARTSYETAPQYGDSSRVVGYASIAFGNIEGGSDAGTMSTYTAALDSTEIDNFTPDEKKHLLDLARTTLISCVTNDETARISNPANPKLLQPSGCFVTLNSRGRLRGCIGNIEPVKPLYEAVLDNTINAALYDPRFPEVSVEELDNIVIDISILTKPRPLEFKSPDDLLSKLIPFEHGVILKIGRLQSTFLPQVWEQLPNKINFLEHLAMKAGAGKDDWRTAEVWVYRAECFGESE